MHYIPVHPTALLDLRQISPTQLPRLHWRLLLPLLDQFCVLGSVEERISSAYKRLDLLHQIHRGLCWARIGRKITLSVLVVSHHHGRNTCKRRMAAFLLEVAWDQSHDAQCC